MVEIKGAEIEEQEEEQKNAAPTQHAQRNRLQEKADLLSKEHPFSKQTKDEVKDGLSDFFNKFKKEFYAVTDSEENRFHVNLMELLADFTNFDNLISADENDLMFKDLQYFNLLVEVAPRGQGFRGRHGTGLMTQAEFTKVVE